jgi:hypothetical protein
MAGEGYRALMRAWLCPALAVAVALMLGGCLPKMLVTQPDLTLHVFSQAGEAVAAGVTLHWWEYPHRRQRGTSIAATDAQGTVVFSETTESEVLMPLVPHGVPAYNWYFCVEAENYRTLIGTVSDVAPGETIEITLTLRSGESLPVCADFDTMPFHSGTPVTGVDSLGGNVHGVYAVDGVHE